MFEKIGQKLGFHKLKFARRRREMGQSLVEVAIIAPIAIFMMIGAFEVGWALRGYLTMVNVNREATRFAIRPGYLDYSIKDAETVGYNRVLTHTYGTLGDQLPLDFENNSKLIISHLVVHTGWPCDPENDIADCNCDEFVNPASNFNQTQVYTYDDLILHPDMSGFDYYAYAYPTHTLTATLINYPQQVEERIRQNNRFNCEILKKDGLPSANNYVITELFYEQPQLFGFPLVSNPLTDPVPLYTHTSMRIVNSRADEAVDTIGPVCDAYPIVVHEDTIKYKTGTKIGHKLDIFDGNGGSDFGWLAWNPDNSSGSESTPYLRDELWTSYTPMNDFTDAREPTDHTLSVGDYVASIDGDKAAVESSDHLVSALIGKEIRIPVWDTFSPGLGTDRDAYHIVGFAWVRIEAASDIDLPGKTIMATYLGPADEPCEAGDPPSVPTPVVTCFGSSKDAYFRQDDTDDNNGSDKDLKVKPDAGKLHHIAIEFDLTSVPAGSNVLEAMLHLYEDNDRDNQTIYFHRITNSWVESQATWDERSAGTSWATLGGDYDAGTLATLTPNIDKQYREINVTGVTQDWVDGTYNNYGLLIRSTGDNGDVKFKSKEEGNASKRPKLCLTYQQP